MPLLLYRYILGDLLRVVLLTTTVLVSVIAFGAAIRPLAEDQILSTLQIAKYIGLALIPMMQFALPFAAGFAATMAFHRMASDNEFVAIAIGGISYPKILVPVAALGLALSLLMVGLTQWVIPKFWGLMEETITQDVTELFQSRIKSGQPFDIGRTQIYAEDLIPQDSPPQTGADKRIVLLGVAAAETGDDGRVVTDITASQAAIDIYREPNRTILKLIMTDTVVYKHSTGELFRLPRVEPQAVVIPGLLHSEARAMTREQLLALRDDPEGYGGILRRRIALVNELFDHEVWSNLRSELNTEGQVTLTDSESTYVIQADRLEKGRFTSGRNRSVIVTQGDEGGPAREFSCAEVVMISNQSTSLRDRSFDVQMMDVTIRDLGEDDTLNNQRQRVSINNVLPTRLPDVDLTEVPVEEVLRRATLLSKGNSNLKRRLRSLEDKMEDLQWEVTARLLKRYSLSATAMLLILLGSVLAIWMRHTPPLTVYLFAFFPSILDLMLISGGEQIMRDGALAVGALVMWSGNLVLVVTASVAFVKLRRN